MYVKQLPIYTIKSSESDIRRDNIIALVVKVLDLNHQFTQSNLPHAKEILKRQIELVERQIDQLIYELYGLTEEEINLVESGSSY